MMRAFFVCAILGLVCSVGSAAVEVGDCRGDYGYAVVVSSGTYSDGSWGAVADALKRKHRGVILQYEKGVEEVLGELTKAFPKFVCFVCTPEEATRDFVADVHRMTRRLDGDPYGDVIWGIVTGYDAQDALRIAKYGEPLSVRRGLSATIGAQVDGYEEGRMYNELAAETMREKVRGGEVEAKNCPQDTTKAIVDSLVEYRPDVFVTSGHATERNWQIGYSYKNGYFRCEGGQWYGKDLRGSGLILILPIRRFFLGLVIV